LTPIAQYQARVAVDDMFGQDGHGADYSILPTAIFTDPELGAVGLTEDEARERGHDVATSTHPLTNVTRSQYVAERHGLYKLVYERGSRRLLGIHVVSRGASDIVQGFAFALRAGATVDEVRVGSRAGALDGGCRVRFEPPLERRPLAQVRLEEDEAAFGLDARQRRAVGAELIRGLCLTPDAHDRTTHESPRRVRPLCERTHTERRRRSPLGSFQGSLFTSVRALPLAGGLRRGPACSARIRSCSTSNASTTSACR
jgi:Pyridine nucleotide-disulphide oxidoreductase, dimerisation domain